MDIGKKVGEGEQKPNWVKKSNPKSNPKALPDKTEEEVIEAKDWPVRKPSKVPQKQNAW